MALVARVTRARIPAFTPTILRRGFADVVVVGASVMDMVPPHPHPRAASADPPRQVAYVDKMPTVGETVLGNSFGTSFGGKGANQAVMAAKVPPSHIHPPPPPTLTRRYARVTADCPLDGRSWVVTWL